MKMEKQVKARIEQYEKDINFSQKTIKLWWGDIIGQMKDGHNEESLRMIADISARMLQVYEAIKSLEKQKKLDESLLKSVEGFEF